MKNKDKIIIIKILNYIKELYIFIDGYGHKEFNEDKVLSERLDYFKNKAEEMFKTWKNDGNGKEQDKNQKVSFLFGIYKA